MKYVRRACVAAVAIALVAACSDSIRSHIYAASPFDTTNMCLGPYQGVDVVDGDDTGSHCAPVCLIGNGSYFVSTVCPPYPPLYAVGVSDAGGTDAAVDPTCAAAVAARACSADAGDAGEAGTGAEAGPDGGGDGGADMDAAPTDAASDGANDATSD